MTEVIKYLHGEVHTYGLKKHQIFLTYLRVNNSIECFPRYDVSQVLRFFSLGVWYLVIYFPHMQRRKA